MLFDRKVVLDTFETTVWNHKQEQSGNWNIVYETNNGGLNLKSERRENWNTL